MSASDQVAKRLQKIARRVEGEIEKQAGVKLGFCLIIFPENDGEEMNHVTNCNPKEAAEALLTLLEHWMEQDRKNAH